ncbi:MAG: cellulose biosynthesis protein BcsG [Candidatus Falkowbacteria bacterium]
MIFWVLYFSAIAYFQISNTINANAFLNLGLCLFVFIPVPENLKSKKIINIIRTLIAYILAITLLWSESYLPPFKVIWNFFVRPELRPSLSYILNFVNSFFQIKSLLIVLAIITIALLFKYTKLKKISPAFFAICILILFITQKTAISKDFIDRFYAKEAARSFSISENPQNNFDVIILQICSLSWDDLQYANTDAKSLLRKFDYVFTNFNSATPYSDPAALRLLQSGCGQKTEGELFATAPDKCYLLNNFRALDYSTYSAWNHDGNYSDFKSIVPKYGKADQPINISSLKPTELSFDNAPIYRDGEVLDLWLKQRETSGKKSLLFYNSISLHTGSSYIDGQKLSEKDEYSLASKNVFSDLDSFLDKIKASQRNTIVILLGEHGAAISGSSVQPSTVRDIPLPSITQVPAAVKIFGPGFNSENPNKTSIISDPVSYTALVKIISNVLETNPQSRQELQNAKVDNNLPLTDLVSESESSIVFQDASGVFYKSKKDKNWNQLPSSFMVKPANYLAN